MTMGSWLSEKTVLSNLLSPIGKRDRSTVQRNIWKFCSRKAVWLSKITSCTTIPQKLAVTQLGFSNQRWVSNLKKSWQNSLVNKLFNMLETIIVLVSYRTFIVKVNHRLTFKTNNRLNFKLRWQQSQALRFRDLLNLNNRFPIRRIFSPIW